jgi:hypothetical protein
MADEPELDRADGESSGSDDEETVKGDRDEDHIAGVLTEEDRPSESPTATAGPSLIARPSQELAQAEQETASEDGATDAIPRLAASPMGSMLSVPDDTPSLQVR